MSNMDSTYSPQSPDLSSFFSLLPKTQQFSKPSISRQPYAPRSPSLPYVGGNSLIHYAPNSYASNSTSNSTANFDNPGELFTIDTRKSSHTIPNPVFPDTQNLLPLSSRQFRSLKPAQASYRTDLRLETQNFYQDHCNITAKSEFTPKNPEVWPHKSKSSNTYTTMSSFRGSRDKLERKSYSTSELITQYNDPNPQKIEIKTKFPVARIKRIMQADEEVGKVAQVTPVAVSKALELFMIALVTGAADKAREKGSKKVSAQHLKMVVDGQPERFDFLADIVGKLGEGHESTSGENNKANRKRKEESESVSDEEKEKVKKKGRGRKKKSGD